MGKKEAAKKAKRAAEAAAAAAKSAAAKSAAAKSAAAAEAGGGAAAAAEPATGLRLAQEIAGLAVEPEPETRETMLVRHKKELRVCEHVAQLSAPCHASPLRWPARATGDIARPLESVRLPACVV